MEPRNLLGILAAADGENEECVTPKKKRPRSKGGTDSGRKEKNEAERARRAVIKADGIRQKEELSGLRGFLYREMIKLRQNNAAQAAEIVKLKESLRKALLNSGDEDIIPPQEGQVLCVVPFCSGRSGAVLASCARCGVYVCASCAIGHSIFGLNTATHTRKFLRADCPMCRRRSGISYVNDDALVRVKNSVEELYKH